MTVSFWDLKHKFVFLNCHRRNKNMKVKFMIENVNKSTANQNNCDTSCFQFSHKPFNQTFLLLNVNIEY